MQSQIDFKIIHSVSIIRFWVKIGHVGWTFKLTSLCWILLRVLWCHCFFSKINIFRKNDSSFSKYHIFNQNRRFLSPKLEQKLAKKSYTSFLWYQPRWMTMNPNSDAARCRARERFFFKIGIRFFNLIFADVSAYLKKWNISKKIFIYY